MNFRKFDRQNIKSIAIIAFSLILMVTALYTGFVKGRIDEDQLNAQANNPSAGIEDLIGNIPDSTIKDNDNNEPQKTAQNDTADTSSDTVIEPPVKEKENTSEKEEKTDKNDTQVAGKEVVSVKLTHPVTSRSIVMDYSYNTDPVFSKTFNEYRSDHEGVDYAASIGEEVHAAAEGVISKIYEDEKLGFTVIINHGSYDTKYSNLDKAIPVSEGDEVDTGTIIGKVGSSAVYESMEDTHLHFGLYINEECVDPKNYMQ